VTAKNIATGVERNSATNENGYYQIPFLPLGEYEVTASATGFATLLAEKVDIALNKTTTVNLSLRISSVKEFLTVTDAAPLIDLTSGQIRRSLESTMVENLPSAGRNFLGFATLLPGFQSNPTSGQNNYTLSSGSSVSFNGTGTRGTTFLTDGVSNDDSSENQNRQPVNISTIKEMQLLTDNFAPEFGRGFGAVMLVDTKSGANQMHGEAYWYLQNSALNARSYFANAAGSHYDATSSFSSQRDRGCQPESPCRRHNRRSRYKGSPVLLRLRRAVLGAGHRLSNQLPASAAVAYSAGGSRRPRCSRA
jgi:hypothetical protein